MTSPSAFRSPEHISPVVDELAAYAVAAYASTTDPVVPRHVEQHMELVLCDLMGVAIAGMRTTELERLVPAWRLRHGDTPVIGTAHRTDPESAAHLAAIAACVLELDEGNRFAVGHPAAHVVFAAIAAAQLTGGACSGRDVLQAVVLGYEVAARFGRATSLRAGWHTHGHWGVTGAACAAALLLGGNERQVAAAIDASTSLMHVTPWATVLSGDFTRNLWMADANRAGLDAARLAIADVVTNRGSASGALGGIIGELDVRSLVADLGSRWLAAEGYLKRHASCSYTHAAVDLVQSLHASRPWRIEEIGHVIVRTHSLAEPLLQRDPTSRLAAMFSYPVVVAAAVRHRAVDPDQLDPDSSSFAATRELSERVTVELLPELDDLLPHRRVTEVEIRFNDGSTIAAAQPNPIGDTAHFPLSATEVRTKLQRLIGRDTAERVEAAVTDLCGSSDVTVAVHRLFSIA